MIIHSIHTSYRQLILELFTYLRKKGRKRGRQIAFQPLPTCWFMARMPDSWKYSPSLPHAPVLLCFHMNLSLFSYLIGYLWYFDSEHWIFKTFSDKDILMILIFPILEQRRFFHSVSSLNVLYFAFQRYFTSWLKLFWFVVATVNGTAFNKCLLTHSIIYA